MSRRYHGRLPARLYELVLLFYPQPFRDEYGPELSGIFNEMLADPDVPAWWLWLSVLADIPRSVVPEQLAAARGRALSVERGSMNTVILRRPSAVLPLIMSVAALSIVLGHVAMYGIAREADEGTAAHLWQLLMAGQLPFIAFYALKWLPRTPGQALLVLSLQALVGLAALAPVFILQL